MVDGVADIVARKIELLETMIGEFTHTAASLAREIAIEEERTRINDPTHVAYSTLAKALAVPAIFLCQLLMLRRGFSTRGASSKKQDLGNPLRET